MYFSTTFSQTLVQTYQGLKNPKWQHYQYIIGKYGCYSYCCWRPEDIITLAFVCVAPPLVSQSWLIPTSNAALGMSAPVTIANHPTAYRPPSVPVEFSSLDPSGGVRYLPQTGLPQRCSYNLFYTQYSIIRTKHRRYLSALVLLYTLFSFCCIFFSFFFWSPAVKMYHFDSKSVLWDEE